MLFIFGAFLMWLACVALPDLVVIPAGWLRTYGPKLWERIKRRSPKE